MTGIAPLIGAVLLIGLGGLFAAVDAAISTASLARVEEMVRDERPGAMRLARVLADRPRYINLVVLLRITCEVSATVLLVSYLDGPLGVEWGLFTAAATMVVVSFVVIGVGPRTVGRQNAYTISLASALPLHAISVLLTPVSRLLVLIGNALTPGRGFRNGPFASEIELREVVDLAQQRGVVADDERRMIQSVFELGDTPAREVMVPRTEMVWIESDKTVAQATSLAVRSGHSRLPVIGENVDDVVGVIYLKDLVQQTRLERARMDIRVGDLMRPAVFVPDSKPLDTLLREMQRDRNHMALLVDEYGAIAGLVTIEDVLEEIVGEINDEYDAGEVAPWEELGDSTFRVSARVPIEDLTELYDDLRIDEDLEVDTVGGLLAHELGRVPLPGAQVSWNGLRLRAEGGPDHRGRVRVGTVLISPEEPSPSEESGT
ncbi:hemolysin family protein [Arthrobacter sp. SLBN-53]|uniref:hemolysin family protein n=1 Tax=Arthrobacter sp. SLBN-53 TaxID=2768412 RepID=UPI00114DE9BD|nr:hemolysin family protein [Arthrobacter sp. SLBN-53]TQK28011.1 CBS domain containing-hemolysin-like protein [Arthrobacter sp. SLBN-53]